MQTVCSKLKLQKGLHPYLHYLQTHQNRAYRMLQQDYNEDDDEVYFDDYDDDDDEETKRVPEYTGFTPQRNFFYKALSAWWNKS